MTGPVHVWRDRYGDELTLEAEPENGEIVLYQKGCTEAVAIIHTSKPVTLSTKVVEKVLIDKSSFDRGWRYGMLQAAGILGTLVILKSVWPS